jgi:ABC-type transporter Mla MlaB component
MAAPSAEYRVPAVVRFANAAEVRLAGERFLEQAQGPVRISLAELRENNSVVVALLLAWVRRARALDRALRIVDVPGDLLNIIELYGVAGVLPLEQGASGTTWSVEDGYQDTEAGAAGQQEQS